MSIRNLFLTTLVGTSAAVKLLVTSYNDGSDGAKGAIETLEFTPGLGEKANSATLKVISKNQECNSAPTWLDTSLGNNKVVCLDEGFAPPNATLVTLDLQGDGSLKKSKEASTIVGPVTTKFYGDNKYVALSHFGPQGAISTFTVGTDGGYTPLQNFTYNTTAGPAPEQANSHVHQAVLDPTSQYLVFPDLGADSVYVYGIDKTNGHLQEFEALKTKPGYGPRHLVFWAPGGSYSNSSTYMFVIHELSNKIVSYKVGYVEAGGLSFQEVHEVGTYGDFQLPAGSVPKAAEIAVSPDGFIIASNRNGTVAQVVNPDPTNSTQIPSDSIVTFKPSNDGKLEFVQLVPSGGSFPRHFALNKAGTLIAVANQNTFNLEIFERCIETGVIGARVASAPGLGPGPITFVQWLE